MECLSAKALAEEVSVAKLAASPPWSARLVASASMKASAEAVLRLKAVELASESPLAEE